MCGRHDNGPMRRIALLQAFLSVLLLGRASAQQPVELERPGQHFQVIFHPGDLPADLAGEFADEAKDVVDGFWPTLAKMVQEPKPTRKRSIHLYAREADFRRAEKASSPYRCPVQVFTAADLTGHVLVWPTLPDAMLRVVRLPYDTRQALLRVAAEQVFSPVVPEGDREGWCRWILVMGAIEAATNPEHRAGRDTGHDDRRDVVVSRRTQNIDMSLDLCMSPGLDYRESWQILWAETIGAVLAQNLAAAQRDWAKQLPLRLARSRQRDAKSRRQEAFLGVLGKGWDRANAAYESLCDTFDPMWEVSRPLVEVGPDRTLLAASGRESASLRAVQERRAGAYAIRGRAELGPGSKDPLVVSFGWDGKTFVAAIFGEGRAEIVVWRESEGRFHMAHGVDAPIESGKPFDFRVEVTAQEVRSFVGGLPACVWAHAGHSVQHMQIVQIKNRVVWIENLVIEDLPPARK